MPGTLKEMRSGIISYGGLFYMIYANEGHSVRLVICTLAESISRSDETKEIESLS